MGYYDLDKEERYSFRKEQYRQLQEAFDQGQEAVCCRYYNDADTYIRKVAYENTGALWLNIHRLREKILRLLHELQDKSEHTIRQTVINAAGEIGKYDFEVVRAFFDRGLFDTHHAPRNAVIGSIKKMGAFNPVPVLGWTGEYLHHPEAEIRREICHGIELRGRTHPADILDMLKELQFDEKPRVRKTLIHVLGQIAYKAGCLEVVVAHLRNWKNRAVVYEALQEILDVHERYKKFAVHSKENAGQYIRRYFDVE